MVLSGNQIARTVASPRRLLPTDVLTLQRTIGNRATARLLQQQDPTPTSNQISRTPAPSLQRDAPIGLAGGEIDSSLENDLRRSQSGGSSLPGGVRKNLEPKLGANLGNVKVHTDSHAEKLNRSLGAKAFTHRNHIYYGKGQSPSNLKLTAHETVHTIQQGAVQQRAAQRMPHKKNVREREEKGTAISRAPIQASSTTPHIQRLTSSQETSLMSKMGRPKFQKAKTAGKLDFFFAKSNSELDIIRNMAHSDLILSTAGTTPSSGSGSTPPTTPSTAPTTPQGKIAWLFEKVQNGAIAFINSAKYAFDSDSILPKLMSGLTGKLKGEISSEALKLELSEMQIPFSTLASTEFEMKLAAKLADQEATPTTTREKLSSLGGKALEGAETDDLIDTTMGVKSEAETGFTFSTAKLIKGMTAPEKNLKLGHRASPTSPGVEFSGEGSVAGKIKLMFGWLRDLANKYIGEPLRTLELAVKEHLLPPTNEESAQQTTLGWLASSTSSMLNSVGSTVMGGLRGTDQYLGGYGTSMASKVWDWSTWAASFVPQWVRDWMPSFDKEGLKKWFADRTKFIEKLDPNNAMPKLGGSVETKGAYVGPLQVEDMDTNVSLDLNIPESYLATWAKEIQEQFFPDSNLAQMLSAGLGGKISLFRLQGYSFSRAKGFRGLIPSLRMGPAFNTMWSMISRAAIFAKNAASYLFHAVFK